MNTAWKRAVTPIKPLILPLWNGGHQLAWRAGEYLGALGHARFERCVCCGRWGPMLRRSRAIPAELQRRWGLSKELTAALVRKETDLCTHCGAQLRGRRLAEVVLRTFPEEKADCLQRWVETPGAQRLRIAEINEIWGVHDALRRHPQSWLSDFSPGAERGAIVNGVRHEDLTALTYSDESFDLILHSETLEHVPDLSRALAELHRVLAPGGLQIFTIPRLPGVELTYARASLSESGEMMDLVTPRVHHPGGDSGYPVFTEFGADLPILFEQAGFELTEWFGPTSTHDLAQVYVARKV